MKKLRRKIPAGMIAIALLLQAGMTTVSAATNDAPETQAVSAQAESGETKDQAKPVARNQTTSAPTVDVAAQAVYANGLPITIEAGSAANTTKIKYGNNSYVTFTDGKAEVDLSGYTIYGGAEQTALPSSSITMTGGIVKEIRGGGKIDLTDTQTVDISIFGGEIGTVYGGGWEGRVSGRVNISISGGKIDKVYGGGELSKATVRTTTINIKDGTIQNVYGGGNEGPIFGNASVTIEGGNVHTVYGGGFSKIADVENTSITMKGGTVNFIFGGGYRGDVSDTASVTMKGGIADYIYGGGESGDVSGNTNVSIEGGQIQSSVYGGGQGGTVSGTASVSIENGQIQGYVYGGGYYDASNVENTSVTIKGGTLNYIYGGGQGGTVSGNTSVSIEGGQIDAVYGGGYTGDVSGTASVTIENGEIRDSVYGGGQKGDVSGDTSVTMKDGTVSKSIFGGGRGGTVSGTASVTIEKGQISNFVFGGGYDKAATVGNTSVTMKGGVLNYIYGGGHQGDVSGNTNVSMKGGTVMHIVGGGNEGDVSGTASVTIEKGQINGSVYGGGYNETASVENTSVTMKGGAANDLFGGGTKGKVSGTASVTIEKGQINGSVYGGGQVETANVQNTSVTINGGILNYIYGGGNNGKVSGKASVSISGGEIGKVYGGGNQHGATVGEVDVTVTDGTVNLINGNGKQQEVTGKKKLMIRGGTILETENFDSQTNDAGNEVYQVVLALPDQTPSQDLSAAVVSSSALSKPYDMTGRKSVKKDGKESIVVYLPEGKVSITWKGTRYSGTVSRGTPVQWESVNSYTVTVDGGTATIDGKAVSTATENETVTVTAEERPGHVFTGWSSEDGVKFADAASPTTTFAMLAKPVTVTANYKPIPDTIPDPIPSYTVTVDGGTATIDGKAVSTATVNDTVTVTAEKRPGYEFTGWSSEDGVKFADAASPTTTFAMPPKAVSVRANYRVRENDQGSVNNRPDSALQSSSVPTRTSAPNASLSILTKAKLDALLAQNAAEATLETLFGQVRLSQLALREIQSQSGTDISLTVRKSSTGYEAALKSGGKTVTSLGQGSLTLTLPYSGTKTPTVSILDENGTATPVLGVTYDSTSKTLTISTNQVGTLVISE